MTPEGLAQTHAAAFAGTGWSEAEFQAYLEDPRVTLCGDDQCFAVIRSVGPEAEVLTLATHPEQQGRGRATAMLRAALATLSAQGVEEVFLEVSATNIAGLTVYRSCGFMEYGRRYNYYKNSDTAVCMKAVLSPAST